MSNELMRSGQSYLAKTSDAGLRKDTGSALMTAGGGGLALTVLAGFIPFISPVMVLIAAVVFGFYLYTK